jgi:hypothetical protein
MSEKTQRKIETLTAWTLSFGLVVVSATTVMAIFY